MPLFCLFIHLKLSLRARGQPTIGDMIDGKNIQQLRDYCEEVGIDISGLEVAERQSNGDKVPSKAWFRTTILTTMMNGDGEEAEEARVQLEELDKCPCDNGVNEEDKMVQCPRCRQWMHLGCAGVREGHEKNFKSCTTCESSIQEFRRAEREGKMGFFENDLDWE